jgi:hypothetical protein
MVCEIQRNGQWRPLLCRAALCCIVTPPPVAPTQHADKEGHREQTREASAGVPPDAHNDIVGIRTERR